MRKMYYLSSVGELRILSFMNFFFLKIYSIGLLIRTELFLARRPSLLETGQNDELLASAMVSKDYHKGYFLFNIIMNV